MIAVTAKAMKGIGKCIDAGASLCRQAVDIDQLVPVLRVWLARGTERPVNGSKPGNVVTFRSVVGQT
jgi:hypothetical protein